YPDVPLTTTEKFEYEDKSGLLHAHKDRKDVWLSYVYDDGGRTLEIHKGPDPSSSPVMTKFEYDPVTKQLTRIANKDAAIEYSKYDAFGRAGQTVTYRYLNTTGLESNAAFRTILDVHVQT